MWLKLLILAGLIYAALVATAYFMQTQVLFPTGSVGRQRRCQLRPNALRSHHRWDILFAAYASRPLCLGLTGSSFWGSEGMPGTPMTWRCICTISFPRPT